MRIQCTNNKTLSKQNMVWYRMVEKNALQGWMTGPIWSSTWLPPVPSYLEILFRKKNQNPGCFWGPFLLPPKTPMHNDVTGHTASLSICSSVSLYEIVWSLLNLLISLPLLPTIAKVHCLEFQKIKNYFLFFALNLISYYLHWVPSSSYTAGFGGQQFHIWLFHHFHDFVNLNDKFLSVFL